MKNLTAALTALLLCFPYNAEAAKGNRFSARKTISKVQKDDDITNKLDYKIVAENGVEISGIRALFKSCKIPDKIKTKKKEYYVIGIGDGAFASSDQAEEIILPNTLTYIGNNAFKDCKKLTSITIPSGVKILGNHAFENCESLKSITIPDNISKIETYTFKDCINLESVKLPSGISSIEDYAFSNCGKLKGINLPDNIVAIGNNAFSGCKILKHVVLPNKLANIGHFAFADCDSLSDVRFPQSLNNIGDYAFYGCKGWANVNIPSDLMTIGYLALAKCRIYNIDADPNNPNFTSVNGILYNKTGKIIIRANTQLNGTFIVPGTIRAIDNGAFSDCKKLKKITIPRTVKFIGASAFQDCENLDVTIENSAAYIEFSGDPFIGCKSWTYTK